MNGPFLVGLAALVAGSSVVPRAHAAPPDPPVAPAETPPAAPQPPSQPAVVVDPPSSPSSPAATRTTAALVAAGVAVVGAGVGTVFGALALENQSEYRKSPTYSNSSQGNNDAAYADGAFALAVAAGVTSLVLYLTRGTTPGASSTTPKTDSPVVSAAPIVTPKGGGAGFLLRF